MWLGGELLIVNSFGSFLCVGGGEQECDVVDVVWVWMPLYYSRVALGAVVWGKRLYACWYPRTFSLARSPPVGLLL